MIWFGLFSSYSSLSLKVHWKIDLSVYFSTSFFFWWGFFPCRALTIISLSLVKYSSCLSRNAVSSECAPQQCDVGCRDSDGWCGPVACKLAGASGGGSLGCRMEVTCCPVRVRRRLQKWRGSVICLGFGACRCRKFCSSRDRWEDSF